jgi:hypothetical protein
MAAAYGVFAIIVERERVDLDATWSLVRGNFIRFFALAMLLGVLYVIFAEYYHWFVITFSPVAPGGGFAKDLSQATLLAFIDSLQWFPIDFLADVLPAITIGLVYVALRDGRLAADNTSDPD